MDGDISKGTLPNFTTFATSTGYSRKYSSHTNVILDEEMESIFSRITLPGVNNINNSFYYTGGFQSPVEISHPHNIILIFS